VCERRDFKFGVQVDHSKFQLTDNELSLKERKVMSRDPV